MNRVGLGTLTFAHTTVDMQTSSLVVLLPVLLTTFNLTYGSAAAIISVNNIIIAIAQPLFGMLSDRSPLRWLTLSGCALCGLAMMMVGFMPDYWLVIAAVVLSGLGSAAFHPEALAHVRTVSGQQQATGSSVFFFGGNLGFALGPLATAFLLEWSGVRGAAWLLLPTLVACLILFWQRRQFIAPPDPTIAQREPRQRRSLAWPMVGIVIFLLLLLVLRSVVMSGLQTFIPLYFSATLGYNQSEIAPLLTILVLMGTLGTLFSGPLAERVGRRVVMVGAMAIVLAALFVFLRSEGVVQLVALAIAGLAITAPWTLTVVMIQDAMPNHLGLAGGLTLGTAYGASGISVAALGIFADYVGLAQTMLLITLLPALVMILSVFVPERKRVPSL
jgi:FSR family fosmidomycin resistance protein-like MFS transporter